MGRNCYGPKCPVTVDNMPPAVTVESVCYFVYFCFKILFLANIGYLRTYKIIFKLQISELIY